MMYLKMGLVLSVSVVLLFLCIVVVFWPATFDEYVVDPKSKRPAHVDKNKHRHETDETKQAQIVETKYEHICDQNTVNQDEDNGVSRDISEKDEDNGVVRDISEKDKYIGVSRDISEKDEDNGVVRDISEKDKYIGVSRDISEKDEDVLGIYESKADPEHFTMRCINLPRCSDRRLFIEQQVHASGFIDKWSFEEAIDGRCLTSVEKGCYVLKDGSVFSFEVRNQSNTDPCVLGCTLSHLKLITDIQSTYCLVIEDDAFLSMVHLHAAFDIDDVIQNAPCDWGIIQLGCNQRYINTYRHWVSADRMYGTYAYLIKKECADQLKLVIDANADGTVIIDHKLSGETYVNADFYIYGLVNKSTDFQTYTHNVLSTYNNHTTLDSTLHVESTSRHRLATSNLIVDLLQTRSSIVLQLPTTSTTDVVDASLCIPCHYGHLGTLKTLLLSLHIQDAMPREIVIALSSVPMEIDATQLTTLLQPLVPDCNIRLYVSHDVQYAGTNRNICIKESLYDILIFVDADDLMYSNRIRIVYELMMNRPALASLFHSYMRPESSLERGAVYAEMLGETIYDLHLDWTGSTSCILVPTGTHGLNGFGLKSNSFCIHNGHPVLRRSRMLQYNLQYTADKRGQDAIFNRRLLQTLGRSDDTMMFINTPLTYYLQDLSSIRFC
jgi:GR25 family glycosyltransferase involved in LPS biosynthesis